MNKFQFTRPFGSIVGLAGLATMAVIPLGSHAQIYDQTQIYQQAQNYTVEINKTQILHLPAPASAVAVGNTAIADVTVHSPNLLFIVGRGYGVTNIIALNDMGQTIMEADIQVKNSNSSTDKRVMLVGQGWQSYACSPFCQPAPVLSDNPKFLAQFKGKDKAIDNTGTAVTAASYPAMSSNPSVLGSALPQNKPPAPVTPTFNPGMQPIMPQAVMSIQQQSEP